MARVAQAGGQPLQDRPHRRGAVGRQDFQPHQLGRDTGRLRQRRFFNAALVDQMIALLGPVARQRSGQRHDQIRDVARRRPAPAAVVEHQRKHRWQPFTRRHCLVFDQVLIQQAGVHHHPHRHPGVDLALEFDQQIHIKPVPGHPHPPDDVILAITQVVGDIAAAPFLQSGKVDECQPVLLHEIPQQTLDHLGVGEQVLVGAVLGRPRGGTGAGTATLTRGAGHDDGRASRSIAAGVRQSLMDRQFEQCVRRRC